MTRDTSSRFPGASASNLRKGLSLLTVMFREGSQVTVCGFGVPFRNPNEEIEAWWNGKAMVDGTTTLVDLLRQREFRFFVPGECRAVANNLDESRLRPEFCYPYGKLHHWDEGRFKALHASTRRKTPFPESYA